MSDLKVELGQRSYEIVIKSGALKEIGALVDKTVGAEGKILLISNPTVFSLYGPAVMESLRKRAGRTIYGEVPDGEEYKTMAWAEKLIDIAVDNHLDRTDTIIALGGGVIGDLAGFVAAVYQRGINFIQVPTTLLAQVDSSVGGKVAVNHPRAKNMIGAFHQPRLVVIDSDVLESLPRRDFLSGMAEVVKYGIITDKDFFKFLEDNVDSINNRNTQTMQEIIRRSCAIKASIVGSDEKEDGPRAILNLGHTFGHALETYAGYGHYRHGEAVALGTVMATELASRLNILEKDRAARIIGLMQKLNMDLVMPDYPVHDLMEIIYQDKKIQGGVLRLVLPSEIGQVELRPDVPRELIEQVLRAEI